MKENPSLPLILLLVIILLGAGFYLSGAYGKLFSAGGNEAVGNNLTLDLTTLQSTIRAVSSPTIEELNFVETIDTLGAKEDISKLRNPFERVYVAPPPPLITEKKAEAAPKKTTTTKKPVARKKRIVRPEVVINGIIWDRSRPFAILNNDIYGEGDIISGYTVQTIQDTMIVLANNEDIFSIVIERE